MRIHVLDASAWLRLFLADGPLPEGLEQAAEEVEKGNAAFAAPELILAEAAHVLLKKVRRGALSVGESDAIWNHMRRTPMELLPAEHHIEAARSMAKELKLSVYDALYLAVARYIGVKLFTADVALRKAADMMRG